MTATTPLLSDADLADRGWPKEAVRAYGRPKATTYASLGISVVLAKTLAERKVRIDRIQRWTEAGMPWPLVADLINTPALDDLRDFGGLLLLQGIDMTEDEIREWAKIGSLDSAYRLSMKGLTARVAAQIPLNSNHLTHLLALVQQALARGIRVDDLPLWVAGDALTTEPPYINDAVFTPWRSIALHKIGMRQAALACAAGLTPAEAATAYDEGSLDESTLRILAGLRAGI